ncbi:PASTA domain-containing protein [Roseivirga sp. BDSF3-8]|uniref:PASTA domain-containing protein n=1 Tax=Roseivirga sp. BDSF3-8 TaxID=3241598 RepID=UPI003531C0B9
MGRHLLFLGSTRNTRDQYTTPPPLALEYYHALEQRWNTLVPAFTAKDGQIKQVFKLEARTKVADIIRRALEVGTFPMVRLIVAESAKTQFTEVLAFGGLIAQVEEGQVRLDFGDLWLIEKGSINRNLPEDMPGFEYTIVAMPRPMGNSRLFDGLAAAIAPEEKTITEDPALKGPSPIESLILKGGDFKVSLEDLSEPERQVILLQDEISLKEHRIDTLKQLSVTQNQEIDSLNLKISKLDTSLQQEKASTTELLQKNETLTASLAEKEQEIAQLNDQVVATTSKSATINDLYRDLVVSVDEASKELEGRSYTLSNVTLDLKTHLLNDQEGLKVQLVDKATALSLREATVSNLNMNIAPAVPATRSASVAVPDFSGMTEQAARKKAGLHRLKLRPVYELNQTSRLGAAFRQIPEAGEEIPESGTVRVWFAKGNKEQ